MRCAVFALLLCLLVAAFGAAWADTANNANATVVKIAFYPLDGFFEYDENGNECGYGVDFLNELKKYGNLEWEYVPADSWEGIKQLMLDGQADVRMPVSESTTPSELCDYTTEPILMTYHAIMTLKDRTDLFYQDYDTLSKLKIAATASLLNKTGLQDYLESIGVLSHLVFFEDYNSCRSALERGYVDALLSNVMDLTDDMKILDKFAVVDNFITTLKGNPCYQQINNALTKMRLENPSFQSKLYEKYYPDRADEPFTKEESEYIAQTESLTVAVYTDRKPVSYIDENGDYQGIAIDMANLLSERIGVPFVYVPVTTDTQLEMLETADLVMPVPQSTNDPSCFVTASLMEPEILMAVRTGSDRPKKGARVGVLDSTPGIIKTMEELDLFELVHFSDNREALNALQRGSIEAFANSDYVLNWMLENPRYDNLSALRYQSFPLGYEICGRVENTVLQSILNKGIRSITEDEKDEIIQNDTKLTLGDFTMEDRLYTYRSQIFATAVAVFVVVLSALFYNHSRTRYIARIKESSRKQEVANRAKSEFLARMSHDMRTPLNVIMGMSRLASENDNPQDTDDCLAKINVSGEFLLGLINDVLDMENIESGKMELHPVPYSGQEFSEYISAVIKPLCEQKNIDFEYTYDGESDFVIMQDKLRINQVYFNLLSNAVKFTPEGGKVTFHTRCRKTERGAIAMDVTIADTGIGMKPEFMKHMFEPFTQESQDVHPVSEGNGLGLSIVKKICDLMGMTISATSDAGCGTTFLLHGEYDIAAPQPTPKPAERTTNAKPTLENKTFLVCEDHPLNQEIIRRLLEKQGAIAVIEDNGKRGVEAFEQSAPWTYAAVLMDIRMPIMDGLQACAAIRALPRADAKSTPIIALTANAYEEDVRKCLEAGMNAHLAKPIVPEKLYQALEQCIEETPKRAESTGE